jgi:hypothetical protein
MKGIFIKSVRFSEPIFIHFLTVRKFMAGFQNNRKTKDFVDARADVKSKENLK